MWAHSFITALIYRENAQQEAAAAVRCDAAAAPSAAAGVLSAVAAAAGIPYHLYHIYCNTSHNINNNTNKKSING